GEDVRVRRGTEDLGHTGICSRLVKPRSVSRNHCQSLPVVWADADDGEMSPIGGQYTVLPSPFRHCGHGGVDQPETEIRELCVDLQGADEIRRENRFQLIGRLRIEDFRDDLPHRTALFAQEVIYFGQDEGWNDDGGRLSESLGVIRPCRGTIGAKCQSTKEATRIGNEALPHLSRSLNSSDSSPSFMSVVTNRPVDGGRRLRKSTRLN